MKDSAIRFELLGPLRVRVGGAEVAITGREQALLAMLLLNVNQPVGTERLVDAIWGDGPPHGARNQLQGCVSRLRKCLAGAGDSGQMIVTGPAGYRIDIDESALDLRLFQRRLAEARTAVEEERRSAARYAYRAALALWRGPALAGVDSDLVCKAAVALDEEHLRVVEECVRVELDLGAAGDLVPELTDLVARYPYREGLHAALLVALYRAGRQADALAAYRRVRELLVDEVGTEPGAELRELHRRILAEDQTLLVPAFPSGPPHRDGAARHSLPRAVADFTGRDDAVARLIDVARPESGMSAVVAIDGMAGSGKTALALHVAHRLVSRYRDAQLYLDLHGHSEQRPLDPASALETLLRQLGVPGGRIPAEGAERAALWRSELAGRHALVVLDNAADAAQVAPLLPGGDGCLALVTSRRRLTGLDAVRILSLGPLSSEEAVRLLAQVAGDRVHAEPELAAEVARRCGHLPLALRLAGARLAHRPAWRVGDLADRLSGARGLLTELATEDRTVADAFALSYAPLPAVQRRGFRMLGLHPGTEFDGYATAALVDLTLADARRLLDALVDQHLVEEVAPDRYRLHDLVREYTQQLTLAADPEPDRTSALARLLDFYLHTAAGVTAPLEWHGWRALKLDDPQRPDLVTEAVAQGTAWLETERPSLVAAVGQAVAAGLDWYAWQLARAAWRFLRDRCYVADLLDVRSPDSEPGDTISRTSGVAGG